MSLLILIILFGLKMTKYKMSDGTVHYFAEDCTKNVGERLELLNQLIFK